MAPLPARARPLLGIDLAVIPGVASTFEAAATSGRILAAPPIAPISPRPGLILLAPVYRRGARTDTPAARRAALLGVAGAWMQPAALGAADPIGFLIYWSAIAICAAFIGASEIIYSYIVHEDATARRRTRRVVGQFLPSLAAGAAITMCFAHLSAALVPLLPGIWAICFGLGVFASRPYLPRASGYVASFYYAAGITLLWIAQGPTAMSGWWVGATFGTGQLLAAGVLWWNLERDH
jgi:hypothetical protein